MPLVFAENEVTASGIGYADRTGISYEYPRRYRHTIRSGECFAYYRGRRRHGGGSTPPVYFGTGIVGRIFPAEDNSDRLVCEILDYQPFALPLPFKDSSGEYFETEGRRRGYFQPGVRKISEDEFERIVGAADGESASKSRSPVTEPLGGRMYGDPKTTREVEAFAVRVALEELARRYAGCSSHVLPPNNPGFDILVHRCPPAEPLHVEVKGTQRRVPVFLVTEGELQFSREREHDYALVIVYAIDLVAGTHRLRWHEGPIHEDNGFKLRPLQWRCEAGGPERR
jgi:hypothetical protein